MAEHPNVALIKKGFAAFAAGDMAALGVLFADNIAWHSSGRGSLSGDFVGKEAVFGNFARVFQTTDSFHQDVHAVLANDDHAAALVNVTATRAGKTVKLQQFIAFHIAKGRVTEGWLASLDQYAADEFWA